MQTYDPLKPTAGVTLFGQLYQVIRDHIATLVSNFSGTSFPANPTAGQSCWRTDRKQMYAYTNDTTLGETGWVEVGIISAGFGAEVANARGTKPTLDQRLDVSLNEDGTLKASTTLNPSQWFLPSLTFTYVSPVSFTVNGDQTDIYDADRMLKCNLAASVIYAAVLTSTYSSGPNTTTVVLQRASGSIDNTLVSVEHSLFRSAASGKSAISSQMIGTGLIEAGDIFQDCITSGLLGAVPSSSLTMIIPGGVAYVLGKRVNKSSGADLTHTYTVSKDTYVDISNAGVIAYSEVANGAGAPSVAANSTRTQKVVTNGSVITSVIDLRQQSPYAYQQNVVTGSRYIGTVYQNTSKRMMTVSASIASDALAANLDVYVDANNPPTAHVLSGAEAVASYQFPITFKVLPGHYYKITCSAGTGVVNSWTEWIG